MTTLVTLVAFDKVDRFQFASAVRAGIQPLWMTGQNSPLLGIKPSDFRFHFLIVLGFKHVTVLRSVLYCRFRWSGHKQFLPSCLVAVARPVQLSH